MSRQVRSPAVYARISSDQEGTSIEARIKDNERRLPRVTRNDALVDVVGNGKQLRTQWARLNLTRQAAIVGAVVDHIVIAPTVERTPSFDHARVDIVWRL